MRTTVFKRGALLVGVMLCWSVVAALPAGATTTGNDDSAAGGGTSVWATYRESFERDLGGWQPDSDGKARKWLVYRTPERALDGRYSLAYLVDGANDDGTVWIERSLPAPPRASVAVRVSFWLYSPVQDITGWPVVGTAAVRDPEAEADLPVIGYAGRTAGWARYAFDTRVQTGDAASIFVAVGISVTWETIRTHHVDLVEVTVVSP